MSVRRAFARIREYASWWYFQGMVANATGHAAMVAFNLLIGIFPFVFVLLFIVGTFVDTDALADNLAIGARELFPNLSADDLAPTLKQISEQSPSFGIIALLGSIWVSSSLWSALDTAFARIYVLPARSWWQQKQFALKMLGMQAALVCLILFLPTVQGLRATGFHDLDLGGIPINGSLITLAVGGGALFLVFCAIYRFVPNYRAPWSHIWPGALVAVAGIGLVNVVFPVYLTTVSTVDTLTGGIGFTLIALFWFYLVAGMILIGAITNSLRHLRAEGWTGDAYRAAVHKVQEHARPSPDRPWSEQVPEQVVTHMTERLDPSHRATPPDRK